MEEKNTKNIISGFQEDFKDLADGFLSLSPDLCLKAFLNYWTDKSVDCIFANRFDPRELLESITEINSFLVKILVGQNQTDNVRIVALYFILCLSLKQPVRLRRKIRVDCDDTVRIEKLCYGHQQAKFAWKQLKSMKALDVVETRTIYGPSMLKNRGSKRDPEIEATSSHIADDGIEDGLRFCENKLEPTLLELQSAFEPYEQIKASLKLDDYQDPTVELVSGGPIRESLNEATDLILRFKADSSQEKVHL